MEETEPGGTVVGPWILARRDSQYNVILLDTSSRSTALILFRPRRPFWGFAADAPWEVRIRASRAAMAASKRFFSSWSSFSAFTKSIVTNMVDECAMKIQQFRRVFWTGLVVKILPRVDLSPFSSSTNGSLALLREVRPLMGEMYMKMYHRIGAGGADQQHAQQNQQHGAPWQDAAFTPHHQS
jgi:hypothetical protein